MPKGLADPEPVAVAAGTGAVLRNRCELIAYLLGIDTINRGLESLKQVGGVLLVRPRLCTLHVAVEDRVKAPSGHNVLKPENQFTQLPFTDRWQVYLCGEGTLRPHIVLPGIRMPAVRDELLTFR